MGNIKYISKCYWLLGCIFLNACQKEAINSKIEGHWKLSEYITADGEKHTCKQLYFSISLWIVEIAEKPNQNGYGTYIGRLEYPSNKTIRIWDFKQRAHTADNGISATIYDLMPFGLNNTDTLFEILKSDGESLILKSDYSTLKLKRF